MCSGLHSIRKDHTNSEADVPASSSKLLAQKELRLLEARRLLKTGGAKATTAAFDVGYESPSQFFREYARKFGVVPSQDMATATG